MRRTILGLLLATPLFLGCLHMPMPWSPDGAWLAYTLEVRPLDRIIAPGWMFATSSQPKGPGAPVAGYQLWATRGSSGTSVLLEESAGPLTAPGWSPDGHALAFGRVVTDADRSNRFEVVILEGLTRRRVISSRPLTELDAEAARLPFQGIAWSPDGRYLAIPQLQPLGLAILRTDNGRVVNTMPDAFLPSWSPVGNRLAFYLRSGGHSLHYVESALGQPRHLLDVGQASQAPVWDRDGSSVAVVLRRSNWRLGDPGADLIDLVRVRLDTQAVDTIRSLSADAGPNRDRPIEGTSIAFDRDAENLFCSAPSEGRPNQVTWYHPRDNEVFKKFSPIDPAIFIGSLSLAPDGRTLAARAGVSEHLSAPLFCEPGSNSNDFKTRLVAPDDAARLEWIATLTQTAATLLADLRAETARHANPQAVPTGRPTILPLLSELNSNSEVALRLRHLGKVGRPLCDRPQDAPALAPATRLILNEARLFFDYLREDYSAALQALATLEPTAETPERRLALLTIRAQILINQGQFVAAERIISFLNQTDQPTSRRVEWVGDLLHLTQETRADRGWPRYLAESSAKIQAALAEAKPLDANSELPSGRTGSLLRQGAPFFSDPLAQPGVEGPFAPGRAAPPRVPNPRSDRPR